MVLRWNGHLYHWFEWSGYVEESLRGTVSFRTFTDYFKDCELSDYQLITLSIQIFGFAEPRFEWLGRRTVFLFSQGTAIIAYFLILVALYTDSKVYQFISALSIDNFQETTWYLIVYLCAYSFQALSTETCYLSVAELMPTDVRVTVAAITNICLRVGTIVASLTKPLKFSYEPALFWINLVVCSVGITVVYMYLEVGPL